MGYGGPKEYVQALRDIVMAVMIEKPETVDTLEDVRAVKGVDMVQWGGGSAAIGGHGERERERMKKKGLRIASRRARPISSGCRSL